MSSIQKQKYKDYKRAFLLSRTRENYAKYIENKHLYVESKKQYGGGRVKINLTQNGNVKSFDVVHDEVDDIRNNDFIAILNDVCFEPKNDRHVELRNAICNLHEQSKLDEVFDVNMANGVITISEKAATKKMQVEYNVDCMSGPQFNGMVMIDVYPDMKEEDIKRAASNVILNTTSKNEDMTKMYDQIDSEFRYIAGMFGTNGFDTIQFEFKPQTENGRFIMNCFSSLKSKESVTGWPRFNAFTGQGQIFNDLDIDRKLFDKMVNFDLSQKSKSIMFDGANPSITAILNTIKDYFSIYNSNEVLQGKEYMFVNKYMNQLHNLIVKLVNIISKGLFLLTDFYEHVAKFTVFYYHMIMPASQNIIRADYYIKLLTQHMDTIMNIIDKIFTLNTNVYRPSCITEIQMQSKQALIQFYNEIQEIDRSNLYLSRMMRYIKN